MLNIKIIKYIMIIILFISSSCKSQEMVMTELKAVYTKTCDIYKKQIIEFLEKDGIHFIDSNNNKIFIVPYLTIIDTNNYENGDRINFYSSISIDTTFIYFAYIRIEDNYYEYEVWHSKVNRKKHLDSFDSGFSSDIVFKNKFLYIVEGSSLLYFKLLGFWYIDEKDIKTTVPLKRKYKNSDKMIDINLFDDVRESRGK